MTSISLCMIVKNEEKHLTRCLTSVKEVVDEIVIVDTGSDDNTLEIADSFNANIYHFKWNNDFSSARNFALSKCQSDWILYLDADEELNKNSVEELQNVINGNYVAVNCTVKSLTDKDSKYGLMKYPRLFPNDKRIKFEGKVHEQIQTSLNNYKIPLVDSAIEIIHYGYILDEESANKKLERNLSLLQANKKNNPYDILKLAQTLQGLKKNNEAEDYFRKVINDRSADAKIKSIALLHYSILLYEKNDLKKSLEVARKGLEINPQSAYLNFLSSIIYLRLDDKHKALDFMLLANEANLNLLNKKEISESEIISDQTDFYLRAITLAVGLGEIDKFKQLIVDLSNYVERIYNFESQVFGQNLLSILSEKELSDCQLEQMLSIINASNLNSFLELVKISDTENVKHKILLSLNNKFPKSLNIKKSLASSYLNINQEEAENLFLECLKIEEDSSIYINLISLYIGKKDFEKVKSTFNQLNSRFSDKPIIKQKIDILSKKLNPILASN